MSDYTDAQLEDALKKLYAAGKTDEARTIAQEIASRRSAPESATLSFFPKGRDPSQSKSIAQERGMLADTFMSPAAAVGGLSDTAFAALAKAGILPQAQMSPDIARTRDLLAGRTGPGPLTGATQAVASSPMFGPGIIGAGFQGAANAAAETPQGGNVLAESGKGAGYSMLAQALMKLGLIALPKGAEPELKRSYREATSEGVPITTGQATGSKPLQLLEASTQRSPYAASVAQKFFNEQQNAFNRSATRRTGTEVTNLPAEFLNDTERGLGSKIEELVAGRTVDPSKEFWKAGHELVNELHPLRSSPAHADAAKVAQTALDLASTKFPSTTELLQTRSELRIAASQAYKADSPILGKAYQRLIDAIDESIGKTVSSENMSAWQKVRQQYASLQNISDVMAKANVESATGNIKPTALWSAVERGMPGGVSRDRAALAPVARIGQQLREPTILTDRSLASYLNPMGIAEGPVFGMLQNPSLQRYLVEGAGIDPFLRDSLVRLPRSIAGQSNQ